MANSVKPKLIKQHGNAELNSENESDKCVETIDHAPTYLGENIVHTYGKS